MEKWKLRKRAVSGWAKSNRHGGRHAPLTWWLKMERQLLLCGTDVFWLMVLKWTQFSFLTAIMESRPYPHKKKKGKSSKDSIKNFWWRCIWKGSQLPRSYGIAVPLNRPPPLCYSFLTPLSPIGCQGHYCSLWDRMFMHVYYRRNDCTVLKHWEFSGWL